MWSMTVNMEKERIAVVGASVDPEKYGHRIFKDLLQNGYDPIPVNPKGGMLLGIPVYTRLSEIPDKISLVITVVPPKVTEQIVDEIQALAIPKIWMQPGSESLAAIQKAKEYGIEVTSHACFMRKHKIW